ncbi:MAG TPA: class I SAM-dependent methyltransferase [Thermoplasmata archaeon]|nr:class I SAM-dependent methyltransferase [Thermoplasmata archaeon]
MVDVGAGTGLSSELLFTRLPWGHDARWGLLEPNRAILDKVPAPLRGVAHRAVADATQLPIASDSADLVVSVGVLCCVRREAIGPAVAEMHRSLRAGGRALISVPPGMAGATDRAMTGVGFRALRFARPGSVVYEK